MMQYNVCETCGANGGRAGNLFKVGNGPNECRNCKDTRQRGEVVIHIDLPRTDEEITKTMAILGEYGGGYDTKRAVVHAYSEAENE